jgi:hypothetical protein
MTDTKHIILLLLILSGISLRLKGQTTVQVVTKTVEKQFAYWAGTEVHLEAEKAEVEVHSWDQSTVKVVLEIESRHPEKAIASAGLDRMEYEMKREGNQVQLRNVMQPSPEDKTSVPSVRAHYQVYLPAACPVFIENNFGKVNISNLINQLQINSSFCAIQLDNLKGMAWVETEYGDLLGNTLFGNLSIEAHRSNITLNELNGEVDIKANYALIQILAGNALDRLKVEADNSDVFLYSPDPMRQNHFLTAQYGQLVLPEGMPYQYSSNNSQLRQASLRANPELPGFSVDIKVSSGNIKISDRKFKY